MNYQRGQELIGEVGDKKKCEYVLESRRSLLFSAFTAMAENYFWRIHVQTGKEGKPGRSVYEAGAHDISHGRDGMKSGMGCFCVGICSD